MFVVERSAGSPTQPDGRRLKYRKSCAAPEPVAHGVRVRGSWRVYVGGGECAFYHIWVKIG